jgi:hypothetical protein
VAKDTKPGFSERDVGHGREFLHDAASDAVALARGDIEACHHQDRQIQPGVQ